MGKKVYAIKEGFNFQTNEKIKDKIVNTWSECLKYVKGVKGAKYKSFEDLTSANKYLSEGSKLLKKGEDSYPEDCLHVYVDGSYNVSTEKYSYGLVAVRNNVIEYINSDSAKDISKKNIRQIAGELEAAVRAVQYAVKKGDKQVVIFHDYEGICHHATGFWERREESSAEYYKKINELMNEGIEVIFVKVDSHTGDFFNELVDEKCKEKLSINSDKVVEKVLTTEKIQVSDLIVKEEILKIAPSVENNIEIISSDRCAEQKEIKEEIFESISKKFKISSQESINAIDLLSEEDKKKFIIYLLNK